MQKEKSPYPLIIFQSSLIWSSFPVMFSFLSSYFQFIGFSASQMGVLVAINPLVAIVLQPVFGIHVDRSTSKNKVFAILASGSVVTVFLLSLGTSYYYIMAFLLVVSIFQVSLTPISESITLEALSKINKTYAMSRMGGTLGYSLTSLLIGWLIGINIRFLFYTIMVLNVIHIIVILKMPQVRGHQTRDNKIKIGELFKDKVLVSFYIFTVVAALMLGYFYTFLPVRYLQIGGAPEGLGLLFFLNAMSEIPFLLWVDRIMKKVSNTLLLAVAMFAFGGRIILLSIIVFPYQAYFIALLNGMTFIVFNYVIATYISQTVRKELKTTGQTVFTVSMGLGRMVGSVAGGYLIDAIGIGKTNFLAFLLSLVTIIWFLIRLKQVNKPGIS